MICNAVRVVSDERRVWVESPLSIAAYGRWEQTLEVGDVRREDQMIAIGLEYLESRNTPRDSVSVKAALRNPAFGVGDTVEVNGEILRCVGMTPKLEKHGWVWAPEFSTLRQEAQIRRDRVVDQLIGAAGGGSSAAAVQLRRKSSPVPEGKLPPKGSHTWGYNTLIELDEEPWQAWEVEDFCRLYEFVFQGDITETAGGPVVTTGNSTAIFSVNGVIWPGIVGITLGPSDTKVKGDLFGYSVLRPGDEVRVWTTARGGHVNGSVELRYTDPI